MTWQWAESRKKPFGLSGSRKPALTLGFKQPNWSPTIQLRVWSVRRKNIPHFINTVTEPNAFSRKTLEVLPCADTRGRSSERMSEKKTWKAGFEPRKRLCRWWEFRLAVHCGRGSLLTLGFWVASRKEVLVPGLLARHRCHPEEEGTHLERVGRVVNGTVVCHFIQEPGVKSLVEHLLTCARLWVPSPSLEKRKNKNKKQNQLL